MATLEQLEVQVKATSKDAGAGIASLSKALTKLDTALSKSFNTSNSVAAMEKLNNSIKALEVSGAISKINSLKEALMQLKSVSKVEISINDISNRLTAAEKKVTVLTAKLKQLNSTKVSVPSASVTTTSTPSATETNTATNSLKSTNSVANSTNGILGKLSSSGGRFGTMVDSLSGKLEQFKAKMSGTATSSKSLTDVFSQLSMIKGVGSTVLSTIGGLVNKSNQYVEDVNLFTASLGEYAGEAQKYAEEASDALGIDPGQFLRNEGTFNSIIEGFGVAGDKAYLMSKNLTQLGYDLSSFFNISQDDAFQKLQSGISGELEPLRRLGYDLSVARLQQEAMNLGINKSVSSMSQAEKSQLRYYAIMTQVTQVQGDMARTLNAPANQLRVLKAQVEMAGRALGNVFIPMLNQIIPYFIAFFKVVRMVASAIASLVGFKMPKVDYSNMNTGASAAKSLADNTGTANSNLGKTPKAANKATKALKKLKSATLGIDELNIISPDEKNTSSGGSGTGSVGSGGVGGLDTGGMGGDLGIDLPEYDFLKGAVTGKADEALKKIKKFISGVAGILMGASLLVIGGILIATGVNLPLGVGLFAAGAIMLGTAAALNFDSMSKKMQTIISGLMKIVSIGLLAVGAVLTFTGANVPLGIGLMLGGLAGMAVSSAMKEGIVGNKVKSMLGIITGIVAVAFLALGAILTFTPVGSTGIGIGLLLAGAGSLAASQSLSGGGIFKKIKSIFSTIWKELKAKSVPLVIIGIIACFIALPVGIGILAVALPALFSSMGISLSFGKIIKSALSAVWKNLGKLSFLMIVMGLILCLSQIGLPLGIGLIAAGAAGLYKEIKDEGGLLKIITDLITDCWEVIVSVGKKIKDGIKSWFTVNKDPQVQNSGKALADQYKKGTEEGLKGKGKDTEAWWDKYILNPLKETSKKSKPVSPNIDMDQRKTGEVWTKFKKGFDKKVAKPFNAKVALVQDKWKSVKDWVNKFSGASAEKKIELIKDKWESVKAWLDKHTGGKFSKGIHLFKAFGKGIQTVKDWLMGKSQSGGKVEKGVSPKKTKTWSKGGIGAWLKSKDNWGTTPFKEVGVKTNKDWKKGIADWLSQKKNFGGNVNKPVGLKKSDWKTVYAFVTSSKRWGKTPEKKISLGKHNWSSVSSWVKQYNKDTTEAKVALKNSTKNWHSTYGGSFKNWVWGGKNVSHEIVVNVRYKTKGKVPKGVKSGHAANGGVFTSDSYETFANGGVIKHYAGGTPDTHGSMFIAGEAGAELVGHINGRTEVMNRFQLASVMEHSISAGMSNFTQFWQELARNVVTCANGIINSVLVSAESMNSHLALANETSYEMVNRLAQYQMNAESRDVARRNSNSEWKSDMVAFYTEYVAPILTAIATDTKRQADKNEKTVVTLGNKTLLTELKRQEKANGYQFTKQ